MQLHWDVELQEHFEIVRSKTHVSAFLAPTERATKFSQQTDFHNILAGK